MCFDIRHRVFVEEQKVPVELEVDEHDSTGAHHFLGRVDGEPVATSRVCVLGNTAKIQRVAVLKNYRGVGLGRELMQFMMDFIQTRGLASIIALDAQVYAIDFYKDLGFVVEGDEFDDAGIPHIRMVMLQA